MRRRLTLLGVALMLLFPVLILAFDGLLYVSDAGTISRYEWSHPWLAAFTIGWFLAWSVGLSLHFLKILWGPRSDGR